MGYSPIPLHLLERNIDDILKWLNSYALNQSIQNFPKDVINNHGSQIFDLISYLTGKSFEFKVKILSNDKKSEKMKKTLKQYEELIKFLKENGAFLNTIRPYYLLSYVDYLLYVKLQNNENLHFSSIKLNETKFNYVSLDAWITLFYQIMKLFFLSRVNVKGIKNFPFENPENIHVPDYYLEGSNLFSSPETLLLRFLNLYYE